MSALTVQSSQAKGSLLEERLDILVNANIKNRAKDHDWMAKVLRSEAGPANYARFQGYLETEVNFYDKLVPELRSLGTPLPKLFPYLWGDYQTFNREVLILERDNDFQPAPISSEGSVANSNILVERLSLKMQYFSFLHTMYLSDSKIPYCV